MWWTRNGNVEGYAMSAGCVYEEKFFTAGRGQANAIGKFRFVSTQIKHKWEGINLDHPLLVINFFYKFTMYKSGS